MTTTSVQSIEQQIEIDAPAQAIFDALTQPDQFVAWWNDEPHHAVETMTSDLRVGGAWRADGHKSDGSRFWMHGEYTQIEAPSVLEFTWNYHWAPEGSAATIVRFELTEQGRGTLVRLTHRGFADMDGFEGHNEGWAIVLPLLRRFFEAKS